MQTFITYIRTLYFVAPEIEKRYYRLFGDLEYDLLALRIETSVMELRLREIKRRVATCTTISEHEERQISVTSHELNGHLYTRLETLHARMTKAREFRYDIAREQQGRLLFSDIASAVIGIYDDRTRSREQKTLDRACEAYGRLDLATLVDLHDQVQELLSVERRETPDPAEVEQWEHDASELLAQHPLRFHTVLDSMTGISDHLEKLKRRITRQQNRLEQIGMTYNGAVRGMRNRN